MKNFFVEGLKWIGLKSYICVCVRLWNWNDEQEDTVSMDAIIVYACIASVSDGRTYKITSARKE